MVHTVVTISIVVADVTMANAHLLPISPITNIVTAHVFTISPTTIVAPAYVFTIQFI